MRAVGWEWATLGRVRNGQEELLRVLDAEIDAKTTRMADAHGAWPCRKGCDACCRNLGELPRFSQAEWQRVEEGLALLCASERAEVDSGVEQALEAAASGQPIVCPFLARESGACRVYAHRPLACRAFGFYVERAEGRYCGQIREGVERGEFEGVVWGNYESLQRRMEPLGAGETLDARARRPQSCGP